MKDSEFIIRTRRKWVELYNQTKNGTLVCHRCGISATTLRKWHRRFEAECEAGLLSKSKRPHHSPNAKLTTENIGWILEMRSKRNLGARRIQAELIRLHSFKLSVATIWKVLNKYGMPYLRSGRTPRKPKSYSREVSGERVQMDTVQIAPGVFQFTATDDCTRMRVLALYPKRTARNTVKFLEDHVLKEFPFPIQRIQTDQGGEFFGSAFQLAMMEKKIKFRPIRPYSPHLNGKLERSQRTDRVEFYATIDNSDPELKVKLKEWQNFYNQIRPHTSLGGKSPMFRYLERQKFIPTKEEIVENYQKSVEDYRSRDYAIDQQTKHRRLSL